MSARLYALKPKHPDAREDFEKLREVWKHEPLEQEPFEHPLWFKSILIFDACLLLVVGIFVLAKWMSQ